MKKVFQMLLAGFTTLACQQSNTDQIVNTLEQKVSGNINAANARIACQNNIEYGFVYPIDNVLHTAPCNTKVLVNRGTTRQIQVRLKSNSSEITNGVVMLKIPQSASFTYTVSCGWGGKVIHSAPASGTVDPHKYLWQQDDIETGWKYLTINISVASTAAAAEATLLLDLNNPCFEASSQDCMNDDTLYMLVN